MRFKILGILYVAVVLPFTGFTQNIKHTVSGYLRDKASGEALIGATVQESQTGAGAVSNEYGFYSLTLPQGTYTLQVNYLGYANQTLEVDLSAKDSRLDISLVEQAVSTGDVVVTDSVPLKHVRSTEISRIKLDIAQIKSIPALFGEVDLFRALQFLPGVQSAGEGTTGFYVRGGTTDQNLILLDEATVYNASHLLGFFSTFNSDAIKDLEIYKGGIPAKYGGRVSSVVDIRMKDGNNQKLKISGGIGLIASRLTIEGPINKGKGSFIVSARRTYADLFLKLSSNPSTRAVSLYFYDLNLKANYAFNQNNHVFLSGYFGRDVFDNGSGFGINWGNSTATFRWNHLFNDRFFSNLTYVYSSFDYGVEFSTNPKSAGKVTDRIFDNGLKYDFTLFTGTHNKLYFGVNSTAHNFDPGSITPIGEQSIFNPQYLPHQYSLESALYLEDEWDATDKLSIRAGLRYSIFSTIGPATIYSYDYTKTDYTGRPTATDSTTYGADRFIKTYGGWEPRVNIRYSLDEVSSLKVSYNRIYQYIHQAYQSAGTLPTTQWIMSNSYIKPQYADQIAWGYFRNLGGDQYELSGEVYYKWLYNQIDFRNFADFRLNPHLERELITGRGWSYGAEFYLRKLKGKTTGWVSYTLSTSMRQIAGINDGAAYSAFSDRPHNLSIVLNQKLTERKTFSASFTFLSGQPITFPSGSYYYNGVATLLYTGRNGYRLPPYHRLDLSLTLENKIVPGRRWHGSWVFSLYNAYGRHNPWYVTFEQNKEKPTQIDVKSVYLFTYIPSVTYNFTF